MRNKVFKEAVLIVAKAVENMPHSFTHTVTHTMTPPTTERKIDSIVITVINNMGERWVMPGIIIDPQQAHVMINGFPYAFVSGKPEDIATQCHMEMEIHYNDVPVRSW